MHDKNIHNEQQDVFSSQIRQKLEHYELPVDDRIWNEIKPKLHRKPSFFAFPWIIISIAALVGGAGAFLYFNAFDEETASFSGGGQYTEIVAVEQSAEKESINSNEYHHSVIENEILTTRNDDNKQTSNDSNSTTLSQPTKEDSYPVSQQLQNTTKSSSGALGSATWQSQELELEEHSHNLIAENINEKTLNEKLFEITENQETLIAANEEVEVKIPVDTLFDNEQQATVDTIDVLVLLYHKDKVSRWHISLKASFSSFPTTLDEFPPMSIGLMLTRNINKRFGIESGLIYSHLRTTHTFKGIDTQYSNITDLHYLGIPLNAVVQIWNNPKWDFYASAGMMAEKGLRQNTRNADETKNSDGIDGLQWSLRASLGVNYQFYRRWGIFAEPALTYYFDNNQPTSAYTEYKTVFGVTGGIRYKF